nr:PREDICTED: E3 ubiquitin-protein ligase CCNB1IP1-like [Bemisia tabaci]
MGEVDFFCNLIGCRKPLFTSAWVTKCSHIFCEEHGNMISQNQVCPACNESLLGNHDATIQNLNPPDIFRSMVLTGLRPDVIVDIIARSMAFRTYQMAQERAYYDSTIQTLETQMNKLEAAHKSEITKMENEMAVLNKRQQQLLTELETQKFRVQEHERILNEKNRQIQTMQMKYESLRCHASFQHFQSQESSSQQPPPRSFGQRLVPPAQPKPTAKTYMTQDCLLQGLSQGYRNQPTNCNEAREKVTIQDSFLQGLSQNYRNQPPNCNETREKANETGFMLNNFRTKPRISPSFPFFRSDKS